MASLTQQRSRSSDRVTTAESNLPRTEDVLADHLYHKVFQLLNGDEYKQILAYFADHLTNKKCELSYINYPPSTQDKDNVSKWWNNNDEGVIPGEACGCDKVMNPHVHSNLKDDCNSVNSNASSTHDVTFQQTDFTQNSGEGLPREFHNCSSNLETRIHTESNNEYVLLGKLSESTDTSQLCNTVDQEYDFALTEDKVPSQPSLSDISETKHTCIETTCMSSRSEVISSIIGSLIARVTGILLEPQQSDIVVILLTDRDELKRRVDKALECVIPGLQAKMSEMQHVEVCPSGSSDKCGETSHGDGVQDTTNDLAQCIYHAVSEQEPQMASKITGMILELDEEVLRDFLQNSDHMKRAVVKAREALNGITQLEPGERETTARTDSLDESRMENVNDDEIGEWVFKFLSSPYQEDAAQITGMLMEMDGSTLRELLNDKQLLLEKAEIAWKVLNKFQMDQAR